MNLEKLKQSGRIIFECVSGSIAYGLSTPKSDQDIRGIYVNPSSEYLGLIESSKQISDEKNDITYYSLKRIFELLQTANPNILELLWMPEDCVRISSTTMEKLIANRDLFISKKCYHTHSGYAFAQIKKAKGQNKKVHNPQPEERPKKEDFCWIIPYNGLRGVDHNGLRGEGYLDVTGDVFPCRPIPLMDIGTDLSMYHVASLEHSHNIFRLYAYGDKAKGVFRGDDMLVCESIPKEDEVDRFSGLLIYNQDHYEKALRDHRSYWDWMENRNDNRWVDQEKGKLHYDQKNMMHCMRLLMSGEHILVQGFPIVRFEGRDKDYLMSIRNGDLKYEDIMAEVDKRMARLEELYKTSTTIPHSVNVKKIENLYRELTS